MAESSAPRADVEVHAYKGVVEQRLREALASWVERAKKSSLPDVPAPGGRRVWSLWGVDWIDAGSDHDSGLGVFTYWYAPRYAAVDASGNLQLGTAPKERRRRVPSYPPSGVPRSFEVLMSYERVLPDPDAFAVPAPMPLVGSASTAVYSERPAMTSGQIIATLDSRFGDIIGHLVRVFSDRGIRWEV